MSAELGAALEHDARRVALTRRSMLVVARAVLGRGRRDVELVEEREDLARPDERRAVRDEHGDLVRARLVDERDPLLGPRRDLVGDELEAELRHPLADRGRERAPLRLVELDHSSRSSRSSENRTASCQSPCRRYARRFTPSRTKPARSECLIARSLKP